MVHEFLQVGESVKENFDDKVFITNKRLIKTNKKTYFEDLNLNTIEGVELKITHFEMVLRVASSFIILYALFLMLSSIEFMSFTGINFKTVSIVCLIVALVSFAIYFAFLKRVTKIYGRNKVLKIGGHDWDVVSGIRHHSFKAQEPISSTPKKASKKKATKKKSVKK